MELKIEVIQSKISLLEDLIEELNTEYVETNDIDLYWIIDTHEIELSNLKQDLKKAQKEINEKISLEKRNRELQEVKPKVSKENVSKYDQDELVLLHVSRCRKYFSYKVLDYYCTTNEEGFIYK